MGIAHIAKFCLNITFWGCHTHFSHIAASQYAKWQHHLIQQVMAHWWLPRHSINIRSTCKLSHCYLSHGLIHTLWHAWHCKSSQWRTESGLRNKHVSYRNIWSLRQYFSPLSSDPCTLQLVASCLWTAFTYFPKEWLIFEIKSNLYLEEAIQSSYQNGQKSHMLPTCSMIISGQ